VTGLHAVASIASGAAITAGAAVRIVGNSRGAWPHYRLYRCADGEWFFLGRSPRALRGVSMVTAVTLAADILFLHGLTPHTRRSESPYTTNCDVRRESA
jgi:crotonobetainyl-CoA:carnitine CoA-transferase CaiB-like acyl-CoA transferase